VAEVRDARLKLHKVAKNWPRISTKQLVYDGRIAVPVVRSVSETEGGGAEEQYLDSSLAKPDPFPYISRRKAWTFI
jgi:hypothetical protein